MTGQHGERRGIRRPGLTWAVGAFALVILGAGCSEADEIGTPAADQTPIDTSAPTDSTPESSPDEPDGDTTAPDESTPGATTPDDTSPEAPPVAESSPDGTVPAGPPSTPETSEPPPEEEDPTDDERNEAGPEDEPDPVFVALALAGFVALLSVAAWWMVRREDPDADIGNPGRHDWPDDQMSL